MELEDGVKLKKICSESSIAASAAPDAADIDQMDVDDGAAPEPIENQTNNTPTDVANAPVDSPKAPEAMEEQTGEDIAEDESTSETSSVVSTTTEDEMTREELRELLRLLFADDIGMFNEERDDLSRSDSDT
eukprot:gene270-92_t